MMELPPRSVDELLFQMPVVAKTANSAWEADFAKDMARRAHWRNWKPTKKQVQVMRRLVDRLFDGSHFEDVIERGGHSAA